MRRVRHLRPSRRRRDHRARPARAPASRPGSRRHRLASTASASTPSAASASSATHFSRREVIDRLPGNAAIGHVRYSTTGETILRNVQPLFAELDAGGFAVGHNGNLTNGLTLRRELVRDGAIMQSTTDTEVILHLVARSRRNRFIDRFIDGLRQLEGAYAFVGADQQEADRRARPARHPPAGARRTRRLSDPRVGDLRARHHRREIRARRRERRGRRVRRGRRALAQAVPADGGRAPASSNTSISRGRIPIVGGRAVYDVRKTMGAQLAREAPADADVIVPVPDSGVPAAIGYAQESGIPYELGIIRNHYVGRTFIEPTQQIRELGVRLKHSANRAVVNGKRIVLVDNSIVRGTTSVKIVQMMRDAGATGGAFPHRLAADHASGLLRHRHAGARQAARRHPRPRGMREFIGADSLAFLSVDGIYRAMGYERRDPERPQFTDHCFTGDYPTPLTDRAAQRSLAAAAVAAGRGELKRQKSRGSEQQFSSMAGLVPAIHVFRTISKQDMDARHKAGPDGGEHTCPSPSPTASRSSPAPRAASAHATGARARQGGRACGRDRPHGRRARRARRRDQGRRRLGDAGAARPEGLRRHRPARRRAARALRQARHAGRQCRHPRRALAARAISSRKCWTMSWRSTSRPTGA